MKLAHINPNESGQWFREGSERRVGKWTYADEINSITVRSWAISRTVTQFSGGFSCRFLLVGAVHLTSRA